MGRPTDYSPEIALQICDSIATSSDGLRKICEAEDMPSDRTVYRWLMRHDEFCQQYARARELQAQILADEIIELADTCREGQVTTIGTKGTETKYADMIERSRLQIDARKWILAKLLPQKYGDRVDTAPASPFTFRVPNEPDSKPAVN